MRIETQAVHAGAERDANGGISPPIELSTTFVHPPDAGDITGYLYARYANPTQDRLERTLAELEGGVDAVAYASGMAAGAALMHTLPTGSHVVLADDCYFSFRALARDILVRWGIRSTIVDATDLDAVRRAIRPDTRLVWVETPSNPLLTIVDVAAVAALAHEVGALLAVDSTFATPLLQRPLALGADVVMHSTTKYIAGHSDVLGGALVIGEHPRAGQALVDKLLAERTVLGPVASPMNAWLTLRGLRTLPCRIAWSSASAQRVAETLAAHPAVDRVHYPGLPSHPQHALARRQMPAGFGGVLSFEVRGGRDRALATVGRLALVTSATSLGGVETLIEHRRSVEVSGSTTPDSLLRLAVGLEHADDLIADLLGALG